MMYPLSQITSGSGWIEGYVVRREYLREGIIAIGETYNCVAKEVPEMTGQNQNPVKKGEVEGQLILGRVH